MILLNSDEITSLISMKDVIENIESYYLHEGDTKEYVPERMFLNDNENTALLMPSFYGDYYSAKIIGIAPGNVQRNEPTLRGNLLLHNRTTMEPLGMFDARTITALRTGAVCGISMKYLSKPFAKKVGVIGTGDQGWSHLLAACAVRPIEEVFVYNRSPKRLQAFIEKAQQHFPELRIKQATITELVSESDIIIATTTSKEPVIPDELITNMRGKHIAASGSFKPFMQELPDTLIKKADRIFVDTLDAFHESGDMIKAKKFGFTEENVQTARELTRLGTSAYKENQLTLFKSVGHAIFDILTAKLIYERSLEIK